MDSSAFGPTITIAAKTPFKTLVCLLHSLRAITGTSQRNRRKAVFDSYLETWRKNYECIYGVAPSSNGSDTFFPFLRLLLPKHDERPTFSLQEFTLSKWFRIVFNLSSDCTTSQTLTAWRRHISKRENVGDYAAVAANALDRHLVKPKKKDLSVEEINNCLDALAEANSLIGIPRKEKYQSTFTFLLQRIDKQELEWLIRILLRDLKLGISFEVIMDLFHKDAKDMFAAHAKLSVVCQKLCDNKVRKPQYGVQLMEPLLPMRAELWDFSKIDAALRITPLIAEIKYDGERFQIHKDGKRFRFFSRPGNDYTAVLGETATEGTLLQYIAHCFRPHAESFIIDGELCPYYTKKRCFGSKADINWMKKLTGSSGCQLCFVAFDILHLNGQVLMDRPWRDRVEILKGLFAEEEGRLVYSIRREFSIIDECMDFLNEIANTEEGLIIKDPRSVYQPKIQSPYWWKLKPEFVGSLCEQLDLLIIGAYRGHGNSVAGNFLLGVIDANNGGADEQPKRFFSICNIAVGFKRTELESLVLKLIPHLRPWDNHSQPDFIVLGSREACRPDYWVHPNVSAVVQVRASQLIRNDGFGAGFALRFPRVVQIRSDKNWSDTTTLSDINRIDRERNRRLGAVNVNVDDLRHPARSFSFRRSSEGSRLPVHEWFVTPKDLTIKSGLFMGKEFCVTTGDDTGEKERIQRLILENGGTCTLHRSNTTFCVISTKVCTKVRNMVIRDPLDIVRPTWIERCIASGSILPWHPDDLLYSKPRTSMVVKRSYDENDDSFTEDVDVDEVERLFSKMDAKLLAETISKDKLDDFVMEKFCSIFWANELILFRGLSFFVLNRQSSIMLEVVADAIKHFGGLVKLNMEEQPSHVVVQRDVNSDDVDALKTTCHKSKIRVVAWTWVIDCISELRLLDEREYYPHEAFTKKIIPSVISVFDCLSDPVAPVIPVV